MSNQIIKLGTRSSELAMWQAKQVAGRLKRAGHPAEIIPIESKGDIVLDKPLHQIGMTGIFTKALDDALLEGTIDIAVHSLKDVPTKMPDGISIQSVLKREENHDLLVMQSEKLDWHSELTFLTGSLRRQSQLASRFPQATFQDLRGNIAKRMSKLQESDADAAVFAYAAVKRLGLKPRYAQLMNWMVPAPAQGVVGIAAREDDFKVIEGLQAINDGKAFAESKAEREFLSALMGGCTTPLGAWMNIEKDQAEFQYFIGLPDGSETIEGKLNGSDFEVQLLVEQAISEAKEKGAELLIKKCESWEN